MTPELAAGARLAAASGSGSTSGIVSILIGVVIIVATIRWTILYRRANKAPVDTEPAPPVRRLGADTDWWRENAGTPTTPGTEPGPVVDRDRPVG